MHCIVSYDIKDGPLRRTIEQEVQNAVSIHPAVRPLTTFYIVQILFSGDYKNLTDRLLGIAKNYPSQLNFVVSPPIQGGGYQGWLPREMWDQIATRTR